MGGGRSQRRYDCRGCTVCGATLVRGGHSRSWRACIVWRQSGGVVVARGVGARAPRGAILVRCGHSRNWRALTEWRHSGPWSLEEFGARTRCGATLVRGHSRTWRTCTVWRHSVPWISRTWRAFTGWRHSGPWSLKEFGARTPCGATLVRGPSRSLARVHRVAPLWSVVVTRGVWRAYTVWRHSGPWSLEDLALVHRVAPLWSEVPRGVGARAPCGATLARGASAASRVRAQRAEWCVVAVVSCVRVVRCV